MLSEVHKKAYEIHRTGWRDRLPFCGMKQTTGLDMDWELDLVQGFRQELVSQRLPGEPTKFPGIGKANSVNHRSIFGDLLPVLTRIWPSQEWIPTQYSKGKVLGILGI